jgi:hypothetical protein
VQRFGFYGAFQMKMQLGFGQLPQEIVHTCSIRLS